MVKKLLLPVALKNSTFGICMNEVISSFIKHFHTNFRRGNELVLFYFISFSVIMEVETDEVVDDPQSSQISPKPNKNGSSKKTTSKKDEDLTEKFQHSWLQMADFKGWLHPVPDNAKSARCGPCDIKLKAGKSELLKHAMTSKHKENLKSKRNIQTIQQSFAKKSAQQAHDESVKSMEVRLAAFYAKTNVAFATSDELVTAIKKGATDSAIVNDFSLSRNKCSAIVKNVIAKTETEELVEILRKTNFCVLLDESTDVAGTKTMCILAR